MILSLGFRGACLDMVEPYFVLATNTHQVQDVIVQGSRQIPSCV